jgi:hypothetical protein
MISVFPIPKSGGISEPTAVNKAARYAAQQVTAADASHEPARATKLVRLAQEARYEADLFPHSVIGYGGWL